MLASVGLPTISQNPAQRSPSLDRAQKNDIRFVNQGVLMPCTIPKTSFRRTSRGSERMLYSCITCLDSGDPTLPVPRVSGRLFVSSLTLLFAVTDHNSTPTSREERRAMKSPQCADSSQDSWPLRLGLFNDRWRGHRAPEFALRTIRGHVSGEQKGGPLLSEVGRQSQYVSGHLYRSQQMPEGSNSCHPGTANVHVGPEGQSP